MKRIRNTTLERSFFRGDVQSSFDISIRSRILSIFILDILHIFYMEVEITWRLEKFI